MGNDIKMETPSQGEATPQPKQTKKSVTIQEVANGFLIFLPGVPTGEIKIAASIDGALQLAKNLITE